MSINCHHHVEYIDIFQEKKSRFGLCSDIYLCISWRLLWMSINCHHHVEYIDSFQEIKSRLWLPNDIYLCISWRPLWMSIDCLHHVEFIDIFQGINHVSYYLMIYTFVFQVKLFGCPLIVSVTYSTLIASFVLLFESFDR